ncbi:MAG: hypothetical protein ACI8W8_003491 [Rhodothermales bacterium]|jgi:hypothetical protein
MPNDATNPYSPPDAPLGPMGSPSPIWSDAGKLVMSRDGSVRTMCIRCGATRNLKLRRFRLYFRNPVGSVITIAGVVAFLALPFIVDGFRLAGIGLSNLKAVVWLSIPVAVIAANLCYPSLRLKMYHALCTKCHRQRSWPTLLGFAVLAVCIAVAYGAPQLLADEVWWFGGSALALLVVARIVQPWNLLVARVKDGEIWLSGPGPEVRARFPNRFDSIDSDSIGPGPIVKGTRWASGADKPRAPPRIG